MPHIFRQKRYSYPPLCTLRCIVQSANPSTLFGLRGSTCSLFPTLFMLFKFSSYPATSEYTFQIRGAPAYIFALYQSLYLSVALLYTLFKTVGLLFHSDRFGLNIWLTILLLNTLFKISRLSNITPNALSQNTRPAIPFLSALYKILGFPI